MTGERRERRKFVGACTRCGKVHAAVVKVPHQIIIGTVEITCDVCDAEDERRRFMAYPEVKLLPAINRVTLHIQPRGRDAHDTR